MAFYIIISYCLLYLYAKQYPAKLSKLEAIMKYVNKISLYIGIAGSLTYYAIFKDTYSLLIFCAIIYLVILKLKLSRFNKTALIIAPLIIFIVFAINTPGFFTKNVNQSLYTLAKRFEKSTAADAIFFANPRDSVFPAFTLFSHRTPVVFFKNVPINDYALTEWKNRLIESRVIKQAGDSFQLLKTESESSFYIDIARKYNAGYILIYSKDIKKYLDTGKVELYDSEADFSLLRIL
jgi:hypothetical protein